MKKTASSRELELAEALKRRHDLHHKARRCKDLEAHKDLEDHSHKCCKEEQEGCSTEHLQQKEGTCFGLPHVVEGVHHILNSQQVEVVVVVVEEELHKKDHQKVVVERPADMGSSHMHLGMR